MDEKKALDMNISDIIMERPYGFHVGSRQFYLYPVTLGKTYLLSRIIEGLGINTEVVKINPYIESLRLCKDKTGEVCRLLAYHTINDREKLFDNDCVGEIIDLFIRELSVDDMAALLVMVLSENNMAIYTNHLGIDADKKELEKVMRVKNKKNNTLTFGGNGVFGSLIIPACEKLNMTPHQVVWGISYQFLQLLMADAVVDVYLSDEEMKKCHTTKGKRIINADDPKNREMIKSMRWN